jgi:hypothetical protein
MQNPCAKDQMKRHTKSNEEDKEMQKATGFHKKRK